MLECGGDFSDDVNNDKFIGDKIIFSFSGCGDFRSIERLEVLGCKGKLESEKDDKPGNMNPEHSYWNQGEQAIDVVVKFKLSNTISEDSL